MVTQSSNSGKRPYIMINFDYSINSCYNVHENPNSSRLRHNHEIFIADARHIPFSDATVDILLEKGLMDSMTADPLTQADNASTILDEYYRVLRPGGQAVILSIFEPNGESKDMLGLLCHFRFRLTCHQQLVTPMELPSQLFCFVYVLTKSS